MDMGKRMIYLRLSDLFTEAASLAKASNTDILVYLAEIAKLELDGLLGDDVEENPETFVLVKQRSV